MIKIILWIIAICIALYLYYCAHQITAPSHDYLEKRDE